ncbi:MAG: succinyl-diaminopimelate desuccinylase [Microvirga sp.]
MTADPIALARDLIRCPSVTPAEGGALALIEQILKRAGFDVHRVTFAEPGTDPIDNLYARVGNAAPHLMLAGHTDVVPPGDEKTWTHPPFAGEIADGVLYGRGAVDMKGGIACKLAAALDYLAAHGGKPKGSLSFLITGDEEGIAVNGTVKLLQWAAERGERFDHAILGEPTNPTKLGDMIKIGRRGSLTGRLVVHGKQGHVAYPQLAENPIAGMVRLVAALKAEPLDGGTAHFDASNLEFTTLDVGNPATNVIPMEARATFNIRFNDRWSPDSLEAELRARLHAAAGNAVRYTASFDPTNAVAFMTAPDSFGFLIEAIEAVTGRRPALSTTGGTSDARFIKNHGPVVEFGLVGQTMHQVDERVAVADLDRLAAIYRNALERYFSPGCVPETA